MLILGPRSTISSRLHLQLVTSFRHTIILNPSNSDNHAPTQTKNLRPKQLHLSRLWVWAHIEIVMFLQIPLELRPVSLTILFGSSWDQDNRDYKEGKDYTFVSCVISNKAALRWVYSRGKRPSVQFWVSIYLGARYKWRGPAASDAIVTLNFKIVQKCLNQCRIPSPYYYGLLSIPVRYKSPKANSDICTYQVDVKVRNKNLTL